MKQADVITTLLKILVECNASDSAEYTGDLPSSASNGHVGGTFYYVSQAIISLGGKDRLDWFYGTNEIE